MNEERRELTDNEKELCKKGLITRTERIKALKEDLSYNEDYKKFKDKWQEYSDKKAEKKKKQEDEYVAKVLIALGEEISMEQKALKSEKDMLSNGVKIKTPTGVN